ncbi:MAG: polysaccharide deacetylase family protein [Clostridia bacterium]|nr:polysaccharide deacetylase family protein [Clostridia bacterium]
MKKKIVAFLMVMILSASGCFAPCALAQEIALYLDSTKIQLMGDSECAIRVTSNAVVKNDLSFTLEYDGVEYPGVIKAGEKETKVSIVTKPVEKFSKTTVAIKKGAGYRVSTSRGKAEVTLIPDPVLVAENGGFVTAPAGETVRVVFKMENNKTLAAPLSLELRDEEGNFLDKKSFSRDYDTATFKFVIPKKWTGTNYVALWLGDKKVSEDYIVEIRRDISAIYSVSTDRHAVAISVDCGSGGSVEARRWLDLMDEYNVKATFFVTGRFADKNRELLKEILDRGHEIGNHSWNHESMGAMKYDEIINEVVPTNQVIAEATGGYVPALFRAPKGKWGFGMNTMLQTLDLTLVQWTFDSKDSFVDITSSKLYRNVTGKNVHPGAIYLFHNDTPCFDVMDEVFAFYRDNGYEMVSISELLPDGEYTIDKNGVVSEKE